MFCRNCGSPIANQAVICVSCGVPVGKANNFCQNCGDITNPVAEVCLRCGMKITSGNAQKSRIAAGLLGIFLGAFGVHRFYLGYVGIGIGIIASNILCGAGALWGLIEGILILTGVGITKDAQGNPLKD